MRLGTLTFLPILAAACVGPSGPPEAYVEHETLEDFVEGDAAGVAGIPDSFRANRVLDDGIFTAANAVSAAQVQRFLESSPYGRRSWLADERVGSKSAAQAIVDGARAEGINPVVMIGRMQVEKSLIAKTSRPSSSSVDYAFGCGCPDGRACNPAYRGLQRQIACAARVLRTHYDGSVNGSGAWRKGRARRTLDPESVTPVNHATASLYAYTPWVLRGRGGNWLVWNITRRFAAHFARQGADPSGGAPADPPPAEPPPAERQPDPPPAERQPRPEADPPPAERQPDPPAAERRSTWVGEACRTDRDCTFDRGRCHLDHDPDDAIGFCTLPCEGLCPDLAGRAPTFCAPSEALGGRGGAGACAEQSHRLNRACGDRPGMARLEVERFVGRSGAAHRNAIVCAPEDAIGWGGGAPAAADDPGAGGADEPARGEPAREEPARDEPAGQCGGGLPASDNGLSCAGTPANTWRCACSDRFGAPVSQVCRDGAWLNYQLNPRDCAACAGDYNGGCDAR